MWPLVSALALFLFACGGYLAVWGGAAVTTVRFHAPQFAGAAADAMAPLGIHSLGHDWRKSARVGKAYPSSNGVVAVALYPDVAGGEIDAMKFVMVDSNVKLLWQLTPASARLKAEQSVERLIEEILADLAKRLASDAFIRKYQDPFTEIIRDAGQKAFEEPDTKEALDEAYKELLGAFGQEFVAEYLKLLNEESKRIMHALFDNFTRNILSFQKNGALDFDPIRAAIEQVMLDPLLEVAVKRRLKKFVSTDAAAKLSVTFGRQLVVNVYQDPRLFNLLAKLMADFAYSDDLRNFELAATKSIREVVLEVLTRGNANMDPIAAAILKIAFIEGQDKIVLMLTGQQLKRLSREDPRTFKPLVKLQAGLIP